MIWYFTAHDHNQSIHPFAVSWLSHGLVTRFATVFLPSFLISGFFFALAGAARGSAPASATLVLVGLLVWTFVPLDAWYERRVLRHDKKSLTKFHFRHIRRARYRGGHGRLMHQRFVYVALVGTKQCPFVCIVFPSKRLRLPSGATYVAAKELFLVGLLDLKTSKSARAVEMGDDDGELLATIVSQRPGILSTEVILQIHYLDAADREQILELSHFDGKNIGVQEWRNALICARAEADRGVAPREPWSALPDDSIMTSFDSFKRALELDGLERDDNTGHGGQLPAAG